MPVYAYKGLNAQGRNVNGIVDADSPKGARFKLRRDGIFPTDLTEEKARTKIAAVGSGASVSQYFERVTPQDLSLTTRQLSTLVGAGLPLVECLSALVEQTENARLKRTLSQVKERVTEGGALADVEWLSLVDQFRVSGPHELDRRLDELVSAGAEGLMLHRADAPYLTGRVDVLFKLKPGDDAEARVLAYLPGTGRFRGLTGALLVETPDGRRFRLGSGLTDALRRHPPPLGSLATYRYHGHTRNGLPRFASFWRIRESPGAP